MTEDIQHIEICLREYKKAVSDGNATRARNFAEAIGVTASRLKDHVSKLEAADDAFHERYSGISFQDDVPLYVWRDAWEACLKYQKEQGL